MARNKRFTLQLSASESSEFERVCDGLGITRTAALRGFVRKFVDLGVADYGIVPITSLNLGAYIQQLGGK